MDKKEKWVDLEYRMVDDGHYICEVVSYANSSRHFPTDMQEWVVRSLPALKRYDAVYRIKYNRRRKYQVRLCGTEPKPDILYICDNKACPHCSSAAGTSPCHHTERIEHAANFVKHTEGPYGDFYVETYSKKEV